MSKKVEPKGPKATISVDQQDNTTISGDNVSKLDKNASDKKQLSQAIQKMIDSDNISNKLIPEKYKVAIKEIYKHIHYVDKELSSDGQFNEELIINFIKNISSVGESELNIRPEGKNESFSIINLDNNKILKKLNFGWLCVHSLNVDVAPGILRDGVIEPWNKKILERILHPGDTFINIGANFGYFSILAGSLVGPSGKVISFEANPMIYECLSYGIFYSGLPNIVDAHNMAISDKEDVVKLYFSPVFSGGGSIINNVNYDGYSSMNTMEQCRIGKSHDTNKHLINGDWIKHSMLNEYIKADSLDSVLSKYYGNLEKIRLIQIDVEGAEKLVLDGSLSTLEKFKPIILVEFDPHTVRDQVKNMDQESVHHTFEKIKNLGYEFYKVMTNDNFEFSHLTIPEDLNSIPHCDIFAIPEAEQELRNSINII